MTDYKTIHGFKVRSYTTEPDNLITGQVWYDKTNKVLQFQDQGAGAWASANNLNTPRSMIGAARSTTAGLVFGGVTHPNTYVGNTETYDGTSFAEVSDLNTSRYSLAGIGTQTAALGVGGGTSGPDNYYANCETWNGSTWTEVADLIT